MTRGVKYEPTQKDRELVESLAGIGITHQMICNVIGIKKRDTLDKYYREELDRGKAKACAKVAKKLFDKCMEGDTASILFWCKTQMGWREKNDIVVEEKKTKKFEFINDDGKD